MILLLPSLGKLLSSLFSSHFLTRASSHSLICSRSFASDVLIFWHLISKLFRFVVFKMRWKVIFHVVCLFEYRFDSLGIVHCRLRLQYFNILLINVWFCIRFKTICNTYTLFIYFYKTLCFLFDSSQSEWHFTSILEYKCFCCWCLMFNVFFLIFLSFSKI